MRLYKKGLGPIGVIFIVILFIIMWFLWLGPYISEIGLSAVNTNSLTGIEAFLYMNLNIIIMVCLFLFIIGFMYFSGGE